MSKRPPIDLMALTTLTTDEASPMAEATQRSTSSEKLGRGGVSKDKPIEQVRTENLSPLNFKVPPAFRQRYRLCALKAGLKLNELLFEALDAWETKQRR